MPEDIFVNEGFLLETKEARTLYHDYAEGLPIIDYHCHLPPEQIAEDRKWLNITQVWLYGDHYKWRAMRANGVPERFCSGNAPDREKFDKWASTVPRLLRNQLYNWTHMELKNCFGISDRLLGPDTADEIWNRSLEKMRDPGFSARGLMRRSKVTLVCTTDDPVDDLKHHEAIAEDETFETRVLPTWRPDRGMAVEDNTAFNAWVDRLAECTGAEIMNFESYLEALAKRHAFFHEMGCRLSDHGLETAYADDYTQEEIRSIFSDMRGGKTPDPGEAAKFKSVMMHEFGIMDHETGWTQQLHLGALRNNNTRMFRKLGPDTGFDSVADLPAAKPLARFLDNLDVENRLAKTIVYNLNPADNVMLVTMMGNFQDGVTPGKMQFGTGWWFLDQKDGMERQIEDLSQNGLLSRFVGMLTDSRSFLSYPRHEYFRRILCNRLGTDMNRGFIPSDIELAGKIVRDICYYNAAEYFGFDLPADK